MTDIEQCPLPQGHQRHRWFDCAQEVKCPGIPHPSAAKDSDDNAHSQTERDTPT